MYFLFTIYTNAPAFLVIQTDLLTSKAFAPITTPLRNWSNHQPASGPKPHPPHYLTTFLTLSAEPWGMFLCRNHSWTGVHPSNSFKAKLPPVPQRSIHPWLPSLPSYGLIRRKKWHWDCHPSRETSICTWSATPKLFHPHPYHKQDNPAATPNCIEHNFFYNQTIRSFPFAHLELPYSLSKTFNAYHRVQVPIRK